MKIEELDKNFVDNTHSYEGIRFSDSRNIEFKTHGLIYDDINSQYLRMPIDIAEKASLKVAELNKCTSGGRIRFKTDSGKIAIKSVMRTITRRNYFAQAVIRGFSLYTDNVFYKTYIPPIEESNTDDKGYTGLIELPVKKFRNITIYFPIYNDVSALYIGLETDCQILPPDNYTITKPILFYGSSITQGVCASRPGNSYDAILCRYLNADYLNFGFGGSAKGEPALAEYFSSLDASLFILDYDWNAPDPDHLQSTHYPFYALYRKKQPVVPIIMMSRPNFDSSLESDIRRREVIKDSYKKGMENGDKNLYFIDGETLFGYNHRDGCTVDGVHPNDLGFHRMADTVYSEIKKIGIYSGHH